MCCRSKVTSVTPHAWFIYRARLKSCLVLCFSSVHHSLMCCTVSVAIWLFVQSMFFKLFIVYLVTFLYVSNFLYERVLMVYLITSVIPTLMLFINFIQFASTHSAFNMTIYLIEVSIQLFPSIGHLFYHNLLVEWCTLSSCYVKILLNLSNFLLVICIYIHE